MAWKWLFICTLLALGCCSVGGHGRVRAAAAGEEEGLWWGRGGKTLVKRDERRQLVSTEYGEITAVRVSDRSNGSTYNLQFITMEPNSLLLPLLLHSEMVFYVHTGTGVLSWADGEGETRRVTLRGGDVFRLEPGSVFFIQSSLESQRRKLRIYAIFANSNDDFREPPMIPYSSIRDLVLGFEKKVLQAAFKVSEEVIEAIKNSTRPPLIVHGVPKSKLKTTSWELESRFMQVLLGRRSYANLFNDAGNEKVDDNKKKKKKKEEEEDVETAGVYNIRRAEPDFENCHGWSLIATGEKLPVLKGSRFGVFMVNLTKGSMMGPHWNPTATEIAVVVEGEGMIRIVCSGTGNETECRNMRFRAGEGDVFAVPRFHPMAQMSFNDGGFAFVGFTTSTRNNHPQYLAGRSSVLQTLERHILTVSFNVTNTTVDHLLGAKDESIILDCTSCAEEEEIRMKEEIEKEKEEAREREEEERRRQEEEARKREEDEERKRREEEEKKRQEEARKREEDEARKKREEEAAREREEEEAREREEEAAREREQEEAREREEEAAREREQEEAREREQEEASREREQEAEAAREREQEAAREREEEAAREQEQEKGGGGGEGEEGQRRGRTE